MEAMLRDILTNPALSDVEKLIQSFDRVTNQIVADSEKAVALKRALGDEEAVIREHIKAETIKHARTILDDCYRVLQHRKAAR